MRFLIVLFSLFTFSGLLTAQKSQQEIYTLAERSSDFSYDQLLDYTEAKLTDKEDIARFFYYWIGQNIEYDLTVDAFELNQPHYAQKTQPLFVFEARKATCLGFTNLYRSFLEYFDITHKSIIGYTRQASNILQNINPVLDHIWSAIHFDDQWHLVDVTWAFANVKTPVSRDHYFMTPPQVFRNDHLPLDDEWFLDGQKLSLEDFKKQPFINPFYYGVAKGADIEPVMEVNEAGETVLYFPLLKGWRFSLSAVNQKNEKTVKLKYKMKRGKDDIQFTLKNYEPGTVLRLDATRKEVNGLFSSYQGLAFLRHTDWQAESKAPFLQFSTKQQRFKK